VDSATVFCFLLAQLTGSPLSLATQQADELLDAAGALDFSLTESYRTDSTQSPTVLSSGYELDFSGYRRLRAQSKELYSSDSRVCVGLMLSRSPVVFETYVRSRVSPIQLASAVLSAVVALFAMFGAACSLLVGQILPRLHARPGSVIDERNKGSDLRIDDDEEAAASEPQGQKAAKLAAQLTPDPEQLDMGDEGVPHLTTDDAKPTLRCAPVQQAMAVSRATSGSTSLADGAAGKYVRCSSPSTFSSKAAARADRITRLQPWGLHASAQPPSLPSTSPPVAADALLAGLRGELAELRAELAAMRSCFVAATGTAAAAAAETAVVAAHGSSSGQVTRTEARAVTTTTTTSMNLTHSSSTTRTRPADRMPTRTEQAPSVDSLPGSVPPQEPSKPELTLQHMPPPAGWQHRFWRWRWFRMALREQDAHSCRCFDVVSQHWRGSARRGPSQPLRAPRVLDRPRGAATTS